PAAPAAAGPRPPLPHHPRHPLAPDPPPAIAQLVMDPRAPAAAPKLGVDRRYLHPKLDLLALARRRATLLPGIEPRPRDREQPTQHPYRVVGLLPVDEREPHAFSFAKKAAAFRRISRSIRSVRFSCRSRLSSSRSAVVSAPFGPRPASTSAWRAHSRTHVSVRSISFAMAPMLRPLVRISSTTSALYSALNFRLALRRPMAHSYRTSVRSGVSTKPGEAHELAPHAKAESSAAACDARRRRAARRARRRGSAKRGRRFGPARGRC